MSTPPDTNSRRSVKKRQRKNAWQKQENRRIRKERMTAVLSRLGLSWTSKIRMAINLLPFIGRKSKLNPLLWDALKENDLSTLRIVLLLGANPNTYSSSSSTPLFYCDYMDRIDAAKLLVAHGANVNAVNEKDQTVLEYLAESTYDCELRAPRVIEFLVDKGADGRIAGIESEMTGADVVSILKKKLEPELRRLIAYQASICPHCKGHGGYGGMSTKFVRCSRCHGTGRLF